MTRALRAIVLILTLTLIIIAANCTSKQDNTVESAVKQLEETHGQLMVLVTERGMADERTRELGQKYMEQLEKLITLGYFERRAYEIPGDVPSAEKTFEKLGQIATEHFPDAQLGTLSSFHDGEKVIILLCDRPDNLQRWEQLMSAAGISFKAQGSMSPGTRSDAE
jgi:hypothetical protein